MSSDERPCRNFTGELLGGVCECGHAIAAHRDPMSARPICPACDLEDLVREGRLILKGLPKLRRANLRGDLYAVAERANRALDDPNPNVTLLWIRDAVRRIADGIADEDVR